MKVTNQSAGVVITATVENVTEGSIIHPYIWSRYKMKGLEDACFKHLEVKHKYSFGDQATGV